LPAVERIDMTSSAEGPLHLLAVIKPRPELAHDAEMHLRQLMVGTRAEPGNCYMDLVVAEDDPGTWYMFEKFLSRADWEAHMQTPHVIDGNASLAGLLREPTELRFFTEK
jgi:quinol monooxygenase YgiN